MVHSLMEPLRLHAQHSTDGMHMTSTRRMYGIICGWAWKSASADLVAQTLQRLVIRVGRNGGGGGGGGGGK